MCYYNSYHNPQSLQFKDYKIKPVEYNAAVASGFDNPEWPVIIKNESGYENVLMEWGFLPNYITTTQEAYDFRHGYKDNKGKYHPPITTLNVIAEEMQEKPMFKNFVGNRCLVLSSGFYEWKHVPKIGKNGQELKSVDKIPHYIYLKDKPYFFMAGICNPLWVDRHGPDVFPNFAICTTAANTLMTEIHNSKKRMPLILDDDLAEMWLNDNLTPDDISEIAKYQYSESDMDAYTVDKDFRASHDPKRPVTTENRGNLLF